MNNSSMNDIGIKLNLAGDETMRNARALKASLVISGLTLVGIGAAILFIPVAFSASNGFDPSVNINLLNETRASGGAVLVSGIITTAGAFIARLIFTSVVISVFMYLSYGFSRVLSMAVDGIPAEGLVSAAVVEISVGLAIAFVYLTYRGNDDEPKTEK